MYFIGVSTAQSRIHHVFPRWTALAGVDGAELSGIDLPLSAEPQAYRAAVESILADTASAGALVTSHKVPVYEFARPLFTEFDADAALLHEVSCIVRRGPRLAGMAVDTITSGLALGSIVARPFPGAVLIFGAGGAGVALAVHLARNHAPRHVVLTDVAAERVRFAASVTCADCRCIGAIQENDALLAAMPAGTLVVNATGLGKDRPGAPVSAGARFPPDAIAWDFNYRGELAFLDYARAQGVRAVDGWEYFLHGWSQIMARVLDFELTPELFQKMRAAA